MKGWMDLVRMAVVVGLMCPSPMAWAQLAEVDPALNAAVEALVLADPEVAGNPELAQLCRTVAESTVTDIRERVAVAQEAAVMQREGVDVNTVIPREVREAAREQFTRAQGDMQRELETLRSANPERARERELMMREGERQMLAFESGERYVPSTEMVAHAREMFSNWESDMTSRGAPQEFVERARMEMARFSSGEGMMFGGGPGHGMEFAGPGPMGGPGGTMPTAEQMQAMGMTADQIQAAQAAGGQMPSVEQMQAMGMTADQIQAAQAGGHTLDGRTYGGGDRNYGINPATGGWEPGMGGGTVYGGGTTDWSAGGGAHVGYTDWSAGTGGGAIVGGTTDWSAGGTHAWEGGGSNYGINPATGGWEPGMGGGTVYGGGTTDWSAGGGTAYGGGTTDWSAGTGGGGYVVDTSNITTAAQERHDTMVEHTRMSTHTLETDGHAEEHWDGNGDNIPDHTHPIGTASHH